MSTYVKNKKSLFVAVIFFILLLLLGSHLVIADEGNNVGPEETTIDLAISQEIEKYLPVDDSTVLLQQKVRIESNNIAVKEQEDIKVSVPKLMDKLPDTAIVLYNGQKLQDNLYSYAMEEGQLYIQNINGQNEMNNTAEYTIIYGYMDTTVQEASIYSRVEVNMKLMDNANIFSNQNDYEATINLIGNKVSVSGRMTSRVNKGYMYTANKENINFAEQYNVEISNLQDVQEINISNRDLNFILEDESVLPADEYIFFDTTIINKENMIKILGEDGQIQVLNENDEIIYVINNATETDENGDIRIEYGSNGLAKNIKFRTSTPKEIGVLEITNIKHLNTNINYDMGQIKSFRRLAEKIVVNDNETVISTNLEEPKTSISVETDKNQLDTMNEQNELEVNVTLKANEPTEKLFNNPYIEVILPSQVESITPTEDIKLLYDEELHIRNYEIENNVIRIYIEGQQTNYKDGIMEGAILNLKLNVKLNNKATDSEEKVQVKCVNDGEEILTESTMNIITPKDVIMVNSIEELNVETVGEANTEQVTLLPSDTNRSYKVKSQVIVNKDNMKDVTIVGDLPTDSNVVNQDGQTLENNMGMTLASDVTTNIEGQTVYYTNNANASSDLQDPNNGWSTERSEDASKYLVTVPEMSRANTVDVEYAVQTDSQMEYNETAYQGYQVEYANEDRTVTNTVEANYLALTTGQGPELQVNLSAKLGNQNLQENDIVKKGEVIQYIVQISNTGNEDVSNVTVKGQIPEGTVYVEAIADYQYYTGQYYQEVDKQEHEMTIEYLPVGQSIEVSYEVRVKNDAEIGGNITGKATIQYNDVTKESVELRNTIEDANIRISIKSTLNDEADIVEGSIIKYQAIIENMTEVPQENLQLTWNASEGYIFQSQQMKEPEGESTNSNVLTIDTIEANGRMVINAIFTANNITESVQAIDVYANLTQNGEQMRSNLWKEEIISLTNVDVALSANNEGEYLEPGDEITYQLSIKNNNTMDTLVYVYDVLPIELTVQEILVNGQVQELDMEQNVISMTNVAVPAGQETIVEIRTVVNQKEDANEVIEISNHANIYVSSKEIISDDIRHIIEYKTIEGTENVDIAMETNNEGEYIHPGDEVTYTITVTNYNTITRDAYLLDQIPSELTVQEVLVNGQPQELGQQRNTVEVLNMQLGTGENNQTVVEIKATVRDDISSFDAVRISNTASLFIEGDEKVTNEVNHIIEYQKEEEETDVDINLEANHIGEYLTAGDEVNYQIILTNNNTIDRVVSVSDAIPAQLDITEVVLNGQRLDLEIIDNVVEIKDITLNTQDNKQAVIEIKTVVKEGTADQTIEISNVAVVTVQDGTEKQSNTIVHLIRYESQGGDIDDPQEGNTTGNNTQGGNTTENSIPGENTSGGGSQGGNNDDPNPETEYEIRGNVWLDGDQNGEMQSEESKISGVNVYLIDITTGEIVQSARGNNIQATTDQNGSYILSGIPRGSYIVAFEYDTSTYKLTAYMQSGVSSARNSKAVAKTMTINGQEKTYGVTDTINLTDRSVANINMGLVQTEIFDLKLDKYITQVSASGGGNSVSYDYNDVSLAKVELRSNLLRNSTVVVEYTIKVTNVGEVSGYARSIVDYIPEGMTFNSELNKGWTQNGAMLYNTSLSNDEIAPNEERSVTLILTKTMTDSETGTYTNTAELGETYNSRGITDINSTPGNRVNGENDMSSADLIISISTGEVVMYVGLTLSLVTIIAVGIYFIKKKVLDVESKERG